ncbi:Potassium voltage-gated channel subfamily S member 2 [Oryzias melastigma]|uniref:Delayed-rectifier potassium channel regulatory subunit KCNS1 n=1 Tax=Oryzias melastigma TaxID=30732 RepID=A0A834BUE1_ORYME|nr:Potassium voltage-gated channel subfamily S member 2 [Oryzias melastigma]
MVKKSLPGWVHQDPEEDLVHVNVGGLKRSLCSSTLKKFPDTRLGKLLACASEEDILQVCDDYDVQQKEFYFDRNPGLFPYVLHFYQTGKLHVMEELCVFSFSQEIEYWGINEFFLDSCCSYRYHDRKLESSRHRSWDDESEVSSIDTSVDEISDLNRDMQHFRHVRYGNLKRCLWLTLENPGYSIPSKLFSLLSIGVVLTSIATMCINSIPEYQTFDLEGKLVEDPTMQTLEVFCICWFTFEVVTRLLLAPNRRKFFRHPLNIIDMVSVVPIYITLLFDVTLGSESELGNVGRLIQVFRLMRIFRVLKLARHSTGLRSLGATLRHSYREVGILLLYLAVGVSVFSGIAYTAECEEDVGLDTIPAVLVVGNGQHDHRGLRRRGAGHRRREAGSQRLHSGRHPGGGAAHHHHLQQVLALLPPAESSGGVGEEQQHEEDEDELRERARRGRRRRTGQSLSGRRRHGGR